MSLYSINIYPWGNFQRSLTKQQSALKRQVGGFSRSDLDAGLKTNQFKFVWLIDLWIIACGATFGFFVFVFFLQG